jgi:hypothetical protein
MGDPMVATIDSPQGDQRLESPANIARRATRPQPTSDSDRWIGAKLMPIPLAAIKATNRIPPLGPLEVEFSVRLIFLARLNRFIERAAVLVLTGIVKTLGVRVT